MPRPDTCGWGHQTRLQGWISCLFIQNKPCWPCHWNANQKLWFSVHLLQLLEKLNIFVRMLTPGVTAPANNEEKCNCAGWWRSLTVMCGFDRVRSHTTWSGYNVPAILDSGPKQPVTRVPPFLHWSSYTIFGDGTEYCLLVSTLTLWHSS